MLCSSNNDTKTEPLPHFIIVITKILGLMNKEETKVGSKKSKSTARQQIEKQICENRKDLSRLIQRAKNIKYVLETTWKRSTTFIKREQIWSEKLWSRKLSGDRKEKRGTKLVVSNTDRIGYIFIKKKRGMNLVVSNTDRIGSIFIKKKEVRS